MRDRDVFARVIRAVGLSRSPGTTRQGHERFASPGTAWRIGVDASGQPVYRGSVVLVPFLVSLFPRGEWHDRGVVERAVAGPGSPFVVVFARKAPHALRASLVMPLCMRLPVMPRYVVVVGLASQPLACTSTGQWWARQMGRQKGEAYRGVNAGERAMARYAREVGELLDVLKAVPANARRVRARIEARLVKLDHLLSVYGTLR
jgi:hypothetical protein